MSFNHRQHTLRMARSRSSVSGVALVIVLVMLTLMAILLIAFLTSASTELRSAKSYATGFDARSLNDSAVNIIISQIQDATATPTNAWASQPGMIRTYDTSGNLVTAYKLYSSSVLRTNIFNPVASETTEVPANWATLPDQYVDLNKPVIVSGVTNYPIIDPDAVATSQSTGPLVPSTGLANSSAAALDSSTTPIQGCYIDTTDTDASNGTLTISATQKNLIPMPVQWLYILQDGTIATMSTAGVVSNATPANPIVGRVAFWTDDESCKVNVNTSGEGTFWDHPYADSANNGTVYTGYERNLLSYSLPAQNEFQRYPGHPAMTSLSVIFPPLAGESTVNYNERIYGIIPRLATGGSTSGTVSVTSASAAPTPNTFRLFDSVDELLFSAASSTPRGVNLKEASPTSTNFTDVDIERTRFFLTANSRAPEVNMFNKPRICLWPLQASTVNNGVTTAAPNCWTAKDSLLAFCSTIGPKSTNPLLYYFQRYNSFDVKTTRTSGQTYLQSLTQSPIPSSQSPTSDWTNIPRNQTLFAYLQYLMSNPIPGIGGSLSGTGGKYASSVRDQIITEMLDFIRSEVSTASTGTTPTYYYAPSQASGTLVTGERQVVPLVIHPPSTPYTYSSPNTAPTANTSYYTKGFGRFETIQQAALVLYRTDSGTLSGNATSGYTFVQPPTPSAGTPGHVGAVLLLNPFNPTPGTRSWCENMRIQISGLSGFLVNGTQIFPSDTATLLLTGINDTVNATALMGPEFFFRYNNSATHIGGSEPGGKTLGATVVGSDTEEQNYPFYGSATLLANAVHLITPASITVNIYSGYDNSASTPSSGALVQTITMPWPTVSPSLALPVPVLPSFSQSQGTNLLWTPSDPNAFNNFNARIGGNGYAEQGFDNDTPSPQHNPSPFIVGGDVVRSVEARYKGPAMGDLRVFAGLQSVPASYFDSYGTSSDSPASDDAGASGGYDSTSTALVHSLRVFNNPNGTGNGFGAYNGYIGPQGLLVSGITSYYQVTAGKRSLYPIVPRGLTGTQVVLTGNSKPGDWDTGPGDQPDGPYINKPDESSSGWNGEYSQGSSQYAGGGQPEEQGNTYSPNRMICSAVAFGSLPTGIDPANPTTAGSGAQSSGGIRPWQTLLFCPNPASEANNSGVPSHPGFGSSGGTATKAPPYTLPPDSSILDFFTMPIVEPYAISDPFSTAGKVNMNYQIVPFTYLVRDTAVRAVLKSTRMAAILPANSTGTAATGAYKVAGTSGPPNIRYSINPDELAGTLNGFKQRFDSGDIFRSAAEICNIYLVPQDFVNSATPGAGETVSTTLAANSPTYATMNTWWKNYTLTGDNLREDPYNQIYPRLTTKSNTYTVHVWTQTLKKAPTTAANAFVSGTDQVTSDYRGSYIVQRYLDPNTDTLVKADGSPGFETDPNSMVGPYKFRVVATKRFAP